MAVATEQDHRRHLGAGEQLHQPVHLLREVRPLLPSVLGGEHLDRGDQHVHLCLTLHQHFLKPAPLRLAQHGAVRSHRVPEIPGVQEDHPHELPRGAEIRDTVNPFLHSPGAFSGHIKEIEEHALRLRPFRKLLPRVVLAVVVIVPGADHLCGFADPRVGRKLPDRAVFRSQQGHVLGVAIDVVTHPDEHIRLERGNGVQSRRRLGVLEARDEDKLADGLDRGGGQGGEEEGGEQRLHDAIGGSPPPMASLSTCRFPHRSLTTGCARDSPGPPAR